MLIGDRGDQLWLSGAACGAIGERGDAARTVVNTLSIDPPDVAGYSEMLY